MPRLCRLALRFVAGVKLGAEFLQQCAIGEGRIAQLGVLGQLGLLLRQELDTYLALKRP